MVRVPRSSRAAELRRRALVRPTLACNVDSHSILLPYASVEVSLAGARGREMGTGPFQMGMAGSVGCAKAGRPVGSWSRASAGLCTLG